MENNNNNKNIFFLSKKVSPTNKSKYLFEPLKLELDSRINMDLYNSYVSLYALSGRGEKIKKELNIEIQKFVPKLEEVIEEMKSLREKGDKWFSSDAFEKLTQLLVRQIHNLKNNPVFVNEYTFLGKSPRIIVKQYGIHISGSKGVIKNLLFRNMNKQESEDVYIEVDLRSAFASMVIQLYPKKYPLNAEAVQFGLWKFIESKYFKKGGFNKKFVKVCVYASYFGGGKTAFIDGILKKIRDSLGLTPAEFRLLPRDITKPILIEAEFIAKIMDNCPLIIESRLASENLSRLFYKKSMICPTGQKLAIHKWKPEVSSKKGETNERKVWSSNFSHYLQSYEQILIQQSFILISTELSELDLTFVASYHDGAILRVKKNKLEKLEQLLALSITEVSKNLGFELPVKWDVKPF